MYRPKVLVACECSQVVAQAFERYGCLAYSCDILPCYGGRPDIHIHGNCLELLGTDLVFFTQDGVEHFVDKWDIIIAHPPCTYLSVAGNAHLNQPGRKRLRIKAADFFMEFTVASCDHIAIENPPGFMSAVYRKPDQTVHPYYFRGEDGKQESFMKKTCLWLFGLPPLVYDVDLAKNKPLPLHVTYRADGSVKKRYTTEMLSGKDVASKRSKFYYGMADAMAAQWVSYLNFNDCDF